jgi:hypothetical protein
MLTLKIKTHNSAFQDGGADSPLIECARILRSAAYKLEEGNRRGLLLDTNGNLVGEYVLTNR